MGFFGRSFYRPGPGVDKDEPRKTGILRFFEICARDFADLVKLNLLFCLCCAPSAALFVFFILGYGTVFLLLSLAAAFPIGGAIASCFFFITRRMRDDPGFVLYDFRRKLKENMIIAMPVGIFCAFVFYAQFYLLVVVVQAQQEGGGVEAWVLAADLAFLALLNMVLPYVFVQIPYFYLKPGQLARNSLILFAVNTPRSFLGSVQGGMIWLLYALFYPYSVIFVPLVAIAGFSMSWLLTLMWIWKPVDGLFKIEETLRQRRDGEGGGQAPG